MIKRSFAIQLLVAATLINASLVSGQDQPNIVLFLVDDADKYQIGCYGAPVYTPNIDQLAEEGLLFHNAHVNSTVCTPSRYGLTTGRFAGRSTYGDYLDEYPKGSQGHPEFNVGLEHNFLNIGHALQAAGYKTGWVGKFHLHADQTLEGGLTSTEKSFLKEEASPDDPRATELFRQEERAYREYIKNKGFSWAKHIYEGNLNEPFKRHNLEWTIEAALDFIDSAGNQPFYLHFNTTLLHGPDGEWERSLQYPETTGEGIVERELQANMPDRSTIQERIESHGYHVNENPVGITWLDDGVGAVMDKLVELGIADNTIFVFLPDHGSANKASLFSKDGTNIPMIIRYPEKIMPGRESSSLIQAIDLLPTFYELAGVEVPAEYHLDGTSLTPLFNNPDEKIHESIYFELGCARAVMTDEYKYIAVRYTQDRIEDILDIPEENLKEKIIRKLIYLNGHVGISARGIRYSPEYLSPDQLYEVSTDPEELHNIAGDPGYQDEIDRMKELLVGHLASFPGRPFGEFIPGDNAAAPDSTVLEYIRNIQYALKNGATLDRDVIVCDGHCLDSGGVEDDDQHTGISRQTCPLLLVHRGNEYVNIQPHKDIDEIRLIDMCGREIENFQRSQSSEIILNENDYQPGVYVIVGRDVQRRNTHFEKIFLN